jgi:hypothetical protein
MRWPPDRLHWFDAETGTRLERLPASPEEASDG